MRRHEHFIGPNSEPDEQAAREAFLVAERRREQMLDNFLKTQDIGRLPNEEQRERLRRAWGGYRQ